MTEDDQTGDDPAMQTRCVHCGREQYPLNVIAVSYGESGCSWCGERSRRMTRDEYLEALTDLRTRLHPPPPRPREPCD